MKIIFLDIDGPLVTIRAWKARGMNGGSSKKEVPFDPICVALLNKVCKVTGAQIVISSSWRTGDYKCKSKLIEMGIDSSYFHKDYETPRIQKKKRIGLVQLKSRGGEISAWLDMHKDIKKYVVLDDDMIKGHKSNLVRVSYENGILFSHYESIIKKLGILEYEKENA